MGQKQNSLAFSHVIHPLNVWGSYLSIKLLYLYTILSQRKWTAERISQHLQKLFYKVTTLVSFVTLTQLTIVFWKEKLQLRNCFH